MNEILKMKVKELKTKICSDEIKSEDVIKVCFERIRKAEPKVKAFLKLNADHSLEQAEEVDNKLKSGAKCGLLEGVPIGIKDNIMVKDESMTSASKYLENYVSPYDATVSVQYPKDLQFFDKPTFQ